jgi:hypothetical protein
MAEKYRGNGKKDGQYPGDENPDDGNPEYENFQRLTKQMLSALKENWTRGKPNASERRSRAISWATR